MRRTALISATLFVGLLGGTLLAEPAAAKGWKDAGRSESHGSSSDWGSRQNEDRYGAERGQRNGPGMQAERPAPSSEELERWWQELPEVERERLRERYGRLENLPPAQQERLHRRWQRFRDLPPEQQERLRGDYRRWKELPANDRERLQRTWRHFQQLSPDQQTRLKKELRALRGLPEAERERRRLELHRQYFPGLPPPTTNR